MFDDLAVIAQLVWEETLAIIPPYLKFKETDRKVYEISESVGKDVDGLRRRASSVIYLKAAHQIYIDWLSDCVSVMFSARSKLDGNALIDHMKAVRVFYYKDSLWLSQFTNHIAEIITVFDARYHILRGEPYRLLPSKEIGQQMLARLTQESS
jgi:hypothetical protein